MTVDWILSQDPGDDARVEPAREPEQDKRHQEQNKDVHDSGLLQTPIIMPSRALVATVKTRVSRSGAPANAFGLAGFRDSGALTGGWTPAGLAAMYPAIRKRNQRRTQAFGVIKTTMNPRNLKLVLGAVACALTVACVTHSPFTEEGIPHSKYLVGGGFQVQYVAPTAGTALVVEESTSKILTTRTLNEEELFDFEVDLEPDDFITTLGISMSDARIALYFVPRKTKD